MPGRFAVPELFARFGPGCGCAAWRPVRARPDRHDRHHGDGHQQLDQRMKPRGRKGGASIPPQHRGKRQHRFAGDGDVGLHAQEIGVGRRLDEQLHLQSRGRLARSRLWFLQPVAFAAPGAAGSGCFRHSWANWDIGLPLRVLCQRGAGPRTRRQGNGDDAQATSTSIKVKPCRLAQLPNVDHLFMAPAWLQH